MLQYTALSPAEVDLIKSLLAFLGIAATGTTGMVWRIYVHSRRSKKNETTIKTELQKDREHADESREALRASMDQLAGIVEAFAGSITGWAQRMHGVEDSVGRISKEITVPGSKETLATLVVELQRQVEKQAQKLIQIDTRQRMDMAARRIGDERALWEGQVGPDGNIMPTKVSAAWVAMTGLERDETEDMQWLRCVAPEDLMNVQLIVAEALRGQHMFDVTFTCIHVRNKTPRKVRMTGKPEWDDAGRLIGWVGLITPQ